MCAQNFAALSEPLGRLRRSRIVRRRLRRGRSRRRGGFVGLRSGIPVCGSGLIGLLLELLDCGIAHFKRIALFDSLRYGDKAVYHSHGFVGENFGNLNFGNVLAVAAQEIAPGDVRGRALRDTPRFEYPRTED